MTALVAAPTGEPITCHPLAGDMDCDGYHAPPRPGQSDDCGGAGYGCPTLTHHPHTRPTPTLSTSTSPPPMLPVTGLHIGQIVLLATFLVAVGVAAMIVVKLLRPTSAPTGKGRRRRRG